MADTVDVCIYSNQLTKCTAESLVGYAYCIKHILCDNLAPFRKCEYIRIGKDPHEPDLQCVNVVNITLQYCDYHSRKFLDEEEQIENHYGVKSGEEDEEKDSDGEDSEKGYRSKDEDSSDYEEFRRRYYFESGESDEEEEKGSDGEESGEEDDEEEERENGRGIESEESGNEYEEDSEESSGEEGEEDEGRRADGVGESRSAQVNAPFLNVYWIHQNNIYESRHGIQTIISADRLPFRDVTRNYEDADNRGILLIHALDEIGMAWMNREEEENVSVDADFRARRQGSMDSDSTESGQNVGNEVLEELEDVEENNGRVEGGEEEEEEEERGRYSSDDDLEVFHGGRGSYFGSYSEEDDDEEAHETAHAEVTVFTPPVTFQSVSFTCREPEISSQDSWKNYMMVMNREVRGGLSGPCAANRKEQGASSSRSSSENDDIDIVDEPSSSSGSNEKKRRNGGSDASESKKRRGSDSDD